MKKNRCCDGIKPLFYQILRKMKLTVLLLFLTVLTGIAADTYSQTTKLNLKLENVSIINILSRIEDQSQFRFFYNEEINLEQTVSLNASNEFITNILDEIFHDKGIHYEIIGRQIILTNRVDLKAQSLQQPKPVSGKVTDTAGSALPGVTVLIKGTVKGVITDSNGNFTITNVPSDAALVFSFVGMKMQEIQVGTKSTINVTMAEDAIGIDEVVAIGYGTRKKETLTGSVASVSNEKLKASPNLNLTNTISGLMPGIITKYTTGEPGRDNPTILIRGRNTTGNNNPLVVVDGIQDVAGWERINSNDIESVSVLKDASAAIYGARASNGVILITTKRGALGKPVVSYTFNQGFIQPTKLPKMANSADFGSYINELDLAAGRTPKFTDAEIQKFRDGSDPNYINENWYDKVLKKLSPQSQHNLNLRGGSENVKYSISGSYTDENSIFKNGSLKYNTYSLRSNVDAQVTKNLKVGFDLNGALEDGNYPGGRYNILTTFTRMNQYPWVPVYWPNGSPSPGFSNGENPAVMMSSASGNKNVKTYRIMVKTSFDLTIPWVKGLGVDGYFSYNNDLNANKDWRIPWLVYNYDKTANTYTTILGSGLKTPDLSQSFNGLRSTLVNLRIKYETQINDHKLSAFIAAEQQNGVSNYFSAFRRDYISPAIDELFAGSLVNQSTDGGRTESGRQNYFGRVSYGFQEKYLVDFTARYDGSSNFPKGNRYGFFPGVSAAWRISQEQFMKNNVPFIDNLKFRASVGTLGNDAIAAFQYLRLYTLGNTGMSFGSSPAATSGLVEGVSPNPNITWEVATATNIGLDASLWNGLLGVSADVFKQRRSNILARRNLTVPVYTGLALPNENIGVVENKGIELELSHTKAIKDFSWRVAGNVTYARNIVIDIDEAQDVAEWKKVEGHVLGASQYYHALGIFRTQAEVDAAPIYPGTKVGGLQYEDKDKNGAITANDMYVMDKPNIPEMVFGFNLNLNYKNFALWANFAGAARVWQYYLLAAGTGGNQIAYLINNRYTPGSMDSKFPILNQNRNFNSVSGLESDFWLLNSSYVRLKTLELSYNLPKSLLSKVKIQSMKLFLNGQNLFTIDKVKFADPENVSNLNAYYPQSKIYNLGLNITF